MRDFWEHLFCETPANDRACLTAARDLLQIPENQLIMKNILKFFYLFKVLYDFKACDMVLDMMTSTYKGHQGHQDNDSKNFF